MSVSETSARDVSKDKFQNPWRDIIGLSSTTVI